jgi:hypothetical protein
VPNPNYFFIDNGTLGHLTRPGNETILVTFANEVVAHSLPDPRVGQAVVTPFSLIEALGFGRRTLPKPTAIQADRGLIQDLEQAANRRDPIQGALTEQIKQDLYNKYFAFYTSAAGFQLADFRAAYERQLSHCSDAGKQVLRNFFEHNLQRDDAAEVIHRKFSLDRLYNYTFPESVRENFEVSAFADIFRGIEIGHEISQYRAVWRIWPHFARKVLTYKKRRDFGMSDPELKAYLQRVHDEVAAGSNDDFLDTEFYHFAIVGKKQGERRMPIYCYTSERPDQVRIRIAFYKTMFLSIRNLLGERFSTHEAAFGKVALVTPEGHISEIIDAGQIDPILKNASFLKTLTAHLKQGIYHINNRYSDLRTLAANVRRRRSRRNQR